MKRYLKLNIVFVGSLALLCAVTVLNIFFFGCAQVPTVDSDLNARLERLEKEAESIIKAKPVMLPGCQKSEYGNYSYQGHIDPQIITRDWMIVEELVRQIGPGQLEVPYRNLDDSDIKAAVFMVYEGAFLGYAYLKGDSVYLYLLDLDSKCYIGKELEGSSQNSFRKQLLLTLGTKAI